MDQEAILEEESREKLLEESQARKFLYRDVEELIEHGFLTMEVTLGKTHVILRSLTPGESRRCFLRGSGKGTKHNFLRWCVASSVWLVDGFEVSTNPTDNGPYHIYKEWVEDLQDSHLEVLASFFSSLRNRVSRALRLVEAFCYEPYSRGLWKLLGKPQWSGRDENTVRRMWVAYNISEDASREEDSKWQHTRMFVGSMSSKAAKELTRHMEKHDQNEKDSRKKVIEQTVNWVIKGDEPEEEVELEVGGEKIRVKKIYSPSSLEELEEEMRKIFRGEEDFHDKMVEEQHQKIREVVQARRQAQQEAIFRARQKLEEMEASGETPSLVGYTKEQLADLNPDVIRGKRTATYSENSEAHRLYDKYFGPKLVPGVVTPDLKVTDSDRTPPSAESLQDKIASRRASLPNSGKPAIPKNPVRED
jgi:hypothetical protein